MRSLSSLLFRSSAAASCDSGAPDKALTADAASSRSKTAAGALVLRRQLWKKHASVCGPDNGGERDPICARPSRTRRKDVTWRGRQLHRNAATGWALLPPDLLVHWPQAPCSADPFGMRAICRGQQSEQPDVTWTEGVLTRQAVFGLDRSALQSEAEAKKAQGYVPARIRGYLHPTDGTLYNAVFDGIQQERAWLASRTLSNFAENHSRFVDQGYRAGDVTSFVDAAGEARFNGVWIRDGIDAKCLLFLTIDEFGAAHDELWSQGYRPVTFDTCVMPDGAPRYSGVFVNQSQLGSKRIVKSLFDCPRPDFAKEAVQAEAAGLRLADVNAFLQPASRSERWSGIREEAEVDSSAAC